MALLPEPHYATGFIAGLALVVVEARQGMIDIVVQHLRPCPVGVPTLANQTPPPCLCFSERQPPNHGRRQGLEK